MRRKRSFFAVCAIMIFLAGCVWSKKSIEADRIKNRQNRPSQYKDVQGNYEDIVIKGETTTVNSDSLEPVTDTVKPKDSSFSDIEYGKYGTATPRLVDFIMEKTSFTICFAENFQALVSYDEAQGRLQIHLPGCRSTDFELPGFYKNEYFDELVIAGSEEGIDVLAYLGKKWQGRIKFEFEEIKEKGYNTFVTDIIVLK